MALPTRSGAFSRQARLPRHQAARRACVCSALLALGLYVSSPFITLFCVGMDLHTHDMAALGRVINWGSLDSSIKQQALAGLHLDAQPPADELPEFGSSFASNAVSNAVDNTVTSANLGTLVDQAMPAIPPEAAPTLSLRGITALLRQTSVRFARLDCFVAEMPVPGHADETPLRVEMRIQGWRWKITNVTFPVAQARTMQVAAPTPAHEA
ncbi:MAG: DUF2939 domain-containing protein [Acetobacter papayae]|uniref:DUF2939 domain-containing protein n=1 Tax=Acetobacter papayae TaxID=1076592 RepID=UPI0039EB5763